MQKFDMLISYGSCNCTKEQMLSVPKLFYDNNSEIKRMNSSVLVAMQMKAKGMLMEETQYSKS